MSTVQAASIHLAGQALDWAVGLADGREMELPSAIPGRKHVVWCDPFVIKRVGCADFHDKTRRRWTPSSDWAQAGELIEKYLPAISFADGLIRAQVILASGEHFAAIGPDHLTAICRAIVLARMGDSVSIPLELMP